MFKSVRRRREKNKIKALFKLQFHATKLTQLAGESLTISVIPDEYGKPTTQLEKAKVQHGSCYWGKPLYETIMFSQDPKTRKIHEKIYHFNVTMGSSKFGGVGEVSIDFASYAAATKISSLSLPLRNANSSAVAILHVSIQRVRGGFDQREGDRGENESYKDRSLRAYFGNPIEDHEPTSGSDIMLSSSNSSSGLDTPQTYIPRNLNPTHESLTTNKSQSQSQTGLSQEVKVNGMLLIGEGDPWALINELRQELTREKDLSSNLRLQLQEKSKSLLKSKSTSKSDDGEDQRALEMIVREHNGVKETYLLEQKIIDLYGEIEFYKRHKDDLEMQNDQIALDYEILKQENHDLRYKIERFHLEEQLNVSYEHETKIESLENELKTKKQELSKAILTITELEADFQELKNAKTHQEQKTIRAYERLQEELRRLSLKMADIFEVNEKAAMEAMDEASKLRVEKGVLEDMFVKVKDDLRVLSGFYEEKLVGILDRVTLKMKQVEKLKKLVEDMIFKHENEKRKSFDGSENVFLEMEKLLEREIEGFERRLDVLAQKTEKSQ